MSSRNHVMGLHQCKTAALSPMWVRVNEMLTLSGVSEAENCTFHCRASIQGASDVWELVQQGKSLGKEGRVLRHLGTKQGPKSFI